MCAPLYAVFIAYMFILTDFSLQSKNPELYQYLVGGILFSLSMLIFIMYRIESRKKSGSNHGGRRVIEVC